MLPPPLRSAAQRGVGGQAAYPCLPGASSSELELAPLFCMAFLTRPAPNGPLPTAMRPTAVLPLCAQRLLLNGTSGLPEGIGEQVVEALQHTLKRHDVPTEATCFSVMASLRSQCGCGSTAAGTSAAGCTAGSKTRLGRQSCFWEAPLT